MDSWRVQPGSEYTQVFPSLWVAVVDITSTPHLRAREFFEKARTSPPQPYHLVLEHKNWVIPKKTLTEVSTGDEQLHIPHSSTLTVRTKWRCPKFAGRRT